MTTKLVPHRRRHHCELPILGDVDDLRECCVCGRRWRWVEPGNPNYARWRLTLASLLGLHRFR